MAFYGKVDYWNERYSSDDGPFEWYQHYEGIKGLLDPEFLSKLEETDIGKKVTSAEQYNPPRQASEEKMESHQRNEKKAATSQFPTKEDCRVLIIGCGNSRLGEDMLKDKWMGEIVNVDFSPVVIDQMNNKYGDEFYETLQTSLETKREEGDPKEQKVTGGKKQSRNRSSRQTSKPQKEMAMGPKPPSKMTFECVDVTKHIPHPDDSFDLIICKGTLDSILCSAGSVANVKNMMEECSRVLDKSHGVMVVVTYGNPDSRLVHFENAGREWWNAGVEVHTVKKLRVGSPAIEDKDPCKHHFVYICKKKNENFLSTGKNLPTVKVPMCSGENLHATKPIPGEAASLGMKTSRPYNPIKSAVAC